MYILSIKKKINRFGAWGDKKTEICEANDIFSQEEIRKIILFCEKFGLDYGELDVLRDNNDKRVYIVDVNNTPTGPSNYSRKQGLTKEALITLKRLAKTFDKTFMIKNKK